jgi:hypothetical protein
VAVVYWFLALSFDLIDDAYKPRINRGGFDFYLNWISFEGCCIHRTNIALSRRSAKQRKRSGDKQPSEGEQSGSGLAIALGPLMCSIANQFYLPSGYPMLPRCNNGNPRRPVWQEVVATADFQ